MNTPTLQQLTAETLAAGITAPAEEQRKGPVLGAELTPMTDAEWLEAATEHDVTYGESH
jgi:hypothetical protein